MLPAAIQVCPIELPGRGRRRDEAPVNDVAVLADQLADALPLQVTCPPQLVAGTPNLVLQRNSGRLSNMQMALVPKFGSRADNARQ